MANDQQRVMELRRTSPPRSLREACVKAGLDRGGRRCPICPIRDLCESEQRWLVKSTAIH